MALSQKAQDQNKAKLFKARVQIIKNLQARKDGLDIERTLLYVAGTMYLPKSYVATLTTEQRDWIWS